MSGTTIRRVTITIPPEVPAAAGAEASRQGISGSAWFTRTASRAAHIADGLAAAAEVFAEIGWPTAEEMAEADRILTRRVGAGEPLTAAHGGGDPTARRAHGAGRRSALWRRSPTGRHACGGRAVIAAARGAVLVASDPDDLAHLLAQHDGGDQVELFVV